MKGLVSEVTGETLTVFIGISAKPRIGAHLEKAPILKTKKVNKRPASNKRKIE